MKNRRIREVLVVVGLFGLMCMMAQPASAVTIMHKIFDTNDCAGYFGDSFGSCAVWFDDNGVPIELSPIISKFETVEVKDDDDNVIDFYLDDPEINSATYGAVDGTEWTITPDDFFFSSGDWTYVPTLPGPDDDFDPALHDPAVRYWVAKAGNDYFKLFWEVNDSVLGTGKACDSDDPGYPFTLGCLNEALQVRSGSWVTPLDNKDNPRNLSHLTFYDSEPATFVIQDVPVPEPGTVLLFGGGLLGLALYGRRRRRG